MTVATYASELLAAAVDSAAGQTEPEVRGEVTLRAMRGDCGEVKGQVSG